MFKQKGGGSKAFWTMLKKNCTFLKGRLPLLSLIFIDVDIIVVDQDMAEKAGEKQKLANDGRQARREDLIMKVASLLGPHFTKL